MRCLFFTVLDGLYLFAKAKSFKETEKVDISKHV